ncbi:MAG: hypothetical protein WDN30_06675 [Pararobbsia sp.]
MPSFSPSGAERVPDSIVRALNESAAHGYSYGSYQASLNASAAEAPEFRGMPSLRAVWSLLEQAVAWIGGNARPARQADLRDRAGFDVRRSLTPRTEAAIPPESSLAAGSPVRSTAGVSPWRLDDVRAGWLSGINETVRDLSPVAPRLARLGSASATPLRHGTSAPQESANAEINESPEQFIWRIDGRGGGDADDDADADAAQVCEFDAPAARYVGPSGIRERGD